MFELDPHTVLELLVKAAELKVWRPCMPAMVAELTDHVWSLREVLRYRVSPWPQPQVA